MGRMLCLRGARVIDAKVTDGSVDCARCPEVNCIRAGYINFPALFPARAVKRGDPKPMDVPLQTPAGQGTWPPYEIMSVASHLVLRHPELSRHSIIHAVNEAAAVCPFSADRSLLLENAGKRVVDLQVKLRR